MEKKSNRVERGETEISPKGEQGVRTIKEKVVYKDGKEVKTGDLQRSNKRARQQGGADRYRAADESCSRGPTGNADQQHGDPEGNGRPDHGLYPYRPPHCYGQVAEGRHVCCESKNLGYGTMFYVPGYGYAVAEDTGANDSSSLVSIDLFMDTKEDRLRWGANAM